MAEARLETAKADYFMDNDDVASKKADYSMRVVTRMTGLPADTIRTWERRYGAVVPQRTPGGSRRFSSHDVKRLDLLRRATQRGHRIRDIADRPLDELQRLSDGELIESSVDLVGDRETPFARTREDYFDAILSFDARRAGEILSRASALFPSRDFLHHVVLPIMRETGERWERGNLSIAQEHLVSMQVRGVLESLLRLVSPQRGAPRVLSATPSGHLHEFGALAGALIAASQGFDTVYLGVDLPEEDLVLAVKKSGAGLLVLSIVKSGSDEEMNTLAESLDRLADQVTTWVGMSESHPLVEKVKKARLIHSYHDFEVALTQLIR
jgi:MerR family transcriptional regulator, light-induced transcriptional regulator